MNLSALRHLPLPFVACAALLPLAAQGARSSASYSIPADSFGTSGAVMQSASYSINGSAAGEFAAGTNVIATSAAYTAKHGYSGALYDIVALSITASPSNNLNENSSRQLAAAPLADDSTTTAPLDPATVTWSIVNGPLTSISSAGLASASTVYQDTSANVAGTGQSLTGQLTLTVLDVTTDDYGAYAGDGLDDGWQVQYFGQPPNSLAGPTADPDGDGQDNLFEFTAGLIPNDPGSRFVLSIQPVAGQPGQKSLLFTPIVTGRTYEVQSRSSLATGSWSPLTGTSQIGSGNQRTVTDPNATGPKLYRVQVAKP